MNAKQILVITGVSVVSFSAGLIVTMEAIKFILKKEAKEMKKERLEEEARMFREYGARRNIRCYSDTYKR